MERQYHHVKGRNNFSCVHLPGRFVPEHPLADDERMILAEHAYGPPTGTLTPTFAVPPPALTPSFAATVDTNVFTTVLK